MQVSLCKGQEGGEEEWNGTRIGEIRKELGQGKVEMGHGTG